MPIPPGISMHKGYAFVQFANPFDARSACVGEDGRNVFGQVLGKSSDKKKVISYTNHHDWALSYL